MSLFHLDPICSLPVKFDVLWLEGQRKIQCGNVPRTVFIVDKIEFFSQLLSHIQGNFMTQGYTIIKKTISNLQPSLALTLGG